MKTIAKIMLENGYDVSISKKIEKDLTEL